jgi:hypothetical protein
MPLEDDEDCLDAYYDDEPLWYCTVANILREQSPSDQPKRIFTQLHLTHAGEPTTYAKAHG